MSSYSLSHTDPNATVPLNLTTTAPWDPTESEPPIDFDPSRSRALRPHPEWTEDGFEVTTSTEVNHEGRLPFSSKKPDIGSVIESFLQTAGPKITSQEVVHIEKSEDGWGELTQSPPAPSAIRQPEQIELSRGGISTPAAAGVSVNNMPQVTPPPVAPIPQPRPPPVITIGTYSRLTLTPVPVTSVRVATVDGKAVTVSSIVDYRYVVGTATLQPGTSTVIDNQAVALKVDSSGNTILEVGGQTTTLPARVKAPQLAQAVSSVQAVKITTTVLEGTTKYLFSGQTLAPGQAITVNGVPISIDVRGQSTVLVMGNVTTTFFDGGGTATTTTAEWGASGAATFGIPRSATNKQPAATSINAGSRNQRPMGQLLANLVGLAALIRTLV